MENKPRGRSVEGGKRRVDQDDRPAGAQPWRARKTGSAGPKRKARAKKPVRGADKAEPRWSVTPDGQRLSDAVIEFMEGLKVPSGVGQGEPLVLEEFQKELIREAIDPVNEDGTRKIRSALWSVARKNGKSALAAALLLVALVGPLAVVNGEVYSAATTRDQAAHVYKMASQMVKLDEELSNLCGCFDATKRIVCYHLGSFYQALAAEAGSTHGGNPHFVIYDELAQAKSRELYDVISTSFDAQPNALLLVISTQSSDPTSVMSELADNALLHMGGLLDDPTFTGRVFTVPIDADPFDETLWKLANPALGKFKMVAGMRSQATKAKRSPAAEMAFRNLHLNQRVDGAAAFVNGADWRECNALHSGEDLAGRRCFGGLDMSGKRDLTSLVLLFPDDEDVACDVLAWHWTPGEDLDARSKQDGAQYPIWRDAGWLHAIEGRTVDYATVARAIAALHETYDIQQIGFDRWRIDDLVREFDDIGVDIPLRPVGQGFKDQAPAIDDLEELVLAHQLRPNNNPVLTYCISNVRVINDPAGNRKFDKRQKNKRIDGASALVSAVATWKRPAETEKAGPSIYETRGVLVL